MSVNDVDDLNELDELPPFEEDLILPEFDDEPGGGVSRTFKIIGALLVLIVVGIVAVLVWWAVGNESGPSPNEQTSTAIIAMNATTFAEATLTREAYDATVTANAIAQVASQEAIATFEFLQTQTQEAAIAQATQTQEALIAAQTATQEAIVAAETATQEAVFAAQTQTALDEAATATAFAQLDATEAAIAQTQAAEAAALTATADAANADATATAAASRTVRGQVIDEEGNIFGGVTLRLYRDDGDGIFNPAEDTAAEANPPARTPEPGEPQLMAYGDTVEESLQRNTVDLWRFEGNAGDIVTIEANAGNPAGMDMYLVLLGPDEQPLVEDDDSGPELDALINGFELPEDGVYTIQVSSVSGPGPYTLRLTGQISAAPGGAAEEDDAADAESAQPRASNGSYIMLAQLGADTPTPIPGGDTFITFTQTDLEGTFAFEDLDPGIYWLVIDYESLPSSIRAMIPPTEELVIMVNVPVTGEVTFTVGVPPTATPDNSIQQTQTALAPTEAPASPTPEEPLVTATVGPDMTATLDQFGLLSDIGASTGLEGGSGLTVLAIAAAGLIAMVFIARRLRTAT